MRVFPFDCASAGDTPAAGSRSTEQGIAHDKRELCLSLLLSRNRWFSPAASLPCSGIAFHDGVNTERWCRQRMLMCAHAEDEDTRDTGTVPNCAVHPHEKRKSVESSTRTASAGANNSSSSNNSCSYHTAEAATTASATTITTTATMAAYLQHFAVGRVRESVTPGKVAAKPRPRRNEFQTRGRYSEEPFEAPDRDCAASPESWGRGQDCDGSQPTRREREREGGRERSVG